MAPADDERSVACDLLSRIERLLPQAVRGEADDAVATIRKALREQHPAEEAEAVIWRLLAVVFGAAAFHDESLGKARHRQVAADANWYRAERLKIDKAVAFLAEHPLVAQLDTRMIRIFSLEDAQCSHGRLRGHCEDIRRALEFLRCVNGREIVILAGLERLGLLPVPKRPYPKVFVGASVVRLRRLRELDASAADEPGAFCCPKDVPAHFPPIPEERKKKRGRPPESQRHDVAEEMIEILHAKGRVTVEKSCEFVSVLLRAFYRIEIDADPLRQGWYRSRRRTSAED